MTSKDFCLVVVNAFVALDLFSTCVLEDNIIWKYSSYYRLPKALFHLVLDNCTTASSYNKSFLFRI